MSETESTDDGRALLESEAPGHIEEIDDDDLSDLFKAEIMVRITATTGIKTNPDTALGKHELNSIYAYLHGGWFFPKRHYGTTLTPPTGDVRMAVAGEANITEYLEDRNKGRRFRKSELIKLCEELEARPDQRPKPGSRG